MNAGPRGYPDAVPAPNRARLVIRRARSVDAAKLMRLVVALAEFERLDPPSASAKRRISFDIFRRKRAEVLLAVLGEEAVGYALYFLTYSSFLGKPTLCLEDIFVLEQHRRTGVGRALFRRCVADAVKNKCGRVEWAVLTWNTNAARFYENLGAKQLSEWNLYRLDEEAFHECPRSVKRWMLWAAKLP